MRYVLLFLISCFSCLASTVTGPIADLAGLGFNPRVEFWPLSTPYNSGNTNVVGPMKSVQAVSGNFSQVLLAGRYLVKFPPTTNSFIIIVPNDNSTYSLSTLSSNVASVSSITSTYFITSNQFASALTNNETRNVTFLGTVVSSGFQGDGNGLTELDADNLIYGSIPIGRISDGLITSNKLDATAYVAFMGGGSGSSIAAGTNIVTVTNGSLVTVHGTANVTQAGLAAGSYKNIKLMGTNYSLNLNYDPATGQDTNYIVMTNRQIKFYGSALDTGITWDGAGTVSAGGGYFQFGSTAYGGSWLARAQNIGIETTVDYGSIRLTDDHRLDGLVKLGNQAAGGLVFPSNNYSGMLAFQSPVTNGAGDFIPGYAGIRAKNATGVSVQSVLGEGQSQAELWLYTLIPLQYANASGGFRSVGDTNWFLIGVTNSAVVKGVTIVSNSLSQWPAAARQNGDVMLVNSNGYLYSLNAYYNSTAWTSTNLLSSPNLIYDTNAQNFFTASGISDSTQKSAVNNLVTSLKASGSLWSKMQVIYPFVGGTSNTHSWNLKDTNTFRVAWTTTGLTHDGNGDTGNGSSGYGNTQYTPSTSASLNDSHLTVYCRTQTPTDAGRFISVTTGATPTTRFELHRNSSSFSAEIHNNTFDSLGVSTDFRGFLGASRTGSSAVGLVNSSSSTTTTTASVSLSAQPVFLLARNWPDYGTDSYSSANLAFATIGAGLSVSELQDLRTIVNAYQTALSRQVP